MAKWLVETTGAFMLQDATHNQTVEPHRPSVVRPTALIQDRVTKGQLKVLDNDLSDDATDEEYADKWAKENEGKTSKPKVETKAPQPPIQGKNESDENFDKRLAAWKEKNAS